MLFTTAIAGIIGTLFARNLAFYVIAIGLQWVIAYVAYTFGKIFASRYLPPKSSTDIKYADLSIILTGLGLIGLISPVIGLLFALPAYCIARHSISINYKNRTLLSWLSGIITIICILNANYGFVLIYSRQ